jgi:hypothetical protein
LPSAGRDVGFLSPDLRARLHTSIGSPRLSASFESDVRAACTSSAWPPPRRSQLMRFICGTPFTARRVSADGSRLYVSDGNENNKVLVLTPGDAMAV